MTPTEKMKQNAHKVAFIANNYPENNLTKIINTLEMPPIDINTALWTAQDLGLIGVPDVQTGDFERFAAPEPYDWGPEIDDLRTALLYSFQELAKKESDLEENYLSQWTQGYPMHHVLIAVKSLLLEEKLFEYVIQDQRVDEKGTKMFEEDENTPIMDDYIFYTLFENKDKLWGQKNFKVNPITGESNEQEL